MLRRLWAALWADPAPRPWPRSADEVEAAIYPFFAEAAGLIDDGNHEAARDCLDACVERVWNLSTGAERPERVPLEFGA